MVNFSETTWLCLLSNFVHNSLLFKDFKGLNSDHSHFSVNNLYQYLSCLVASLIEYPFYHLVHLVLLVHYLASHFHPINFVCFQDQRQILNPFQIPQWSLRLLSCIEN